MIASRSSVASSARVVASAAKSNTTRANHRCQLNRAIVRRYLDGAQAALDDVEALADPLDNYYLFHATRAELLRDLGREADARLAVMRALTLTENPAERALLTKRLA